MDDLETIATELVIEAEERNRRNANDMYDALRRIVEECRKQTPDIAWVKRCAERGLAPR